MTFPARGSRLTYTVSTTKLLKHFRLKVTKSAGKRVQLAGFEIYGAAIAEAGDKSFLSPTSIDATAVGLSNTELIGRINDGSRTTCYRAAFTEPVSITFSFDQPVSLNHYGITAGKNEPTRDPVEWRLEGSNDNGGTWVTLDSRTDQSFSHRYATQFYAVNNQTEFDTYRFTVTKTAGATQLQIGELQLLNLEPIDATGINEVSSTHPSVQKSIYDLSGRKVSGQLKRGIYIIDGKKTVIN